MNDEGIFVLFREGKVEAYSIYEDTIHRIYDERKDYFDIKYITGKLAEEVQDKYPTYNLLKMKL